MSLIWTMQLDPENPTTPPYLRRTPTSLISNIDISSHTNSTSPYLSSPHLISLPLQVHEMLDMPDAAPISNPRRILAVSLEDATHHLSRMVKGLSTAPPSNHIHSSQRRIGDLNIVQTSPAPPPSPHPPPSPAHPTICPSPRPTTRPPSPCGSTSSPRPANGPPRSSPTRPGRSSPS